MFLIGHSLFFLQNFKIYYSVIGSAHSRSANKYNRLVKKIERISELMDLIIIKISTSSTIVPPILVTFINYFILGIGDESFRYDGVSWWPFNPNKPIGFFIAMLFTTVATFAVFCFFTPIVCIFVGSCWTIVTSLKDIAGDISHLRKRKILKLNQQRLTKRVCNFIRFHTDVEELSWYLLWGFNMLL